MIVRDGRRNESANTPAPGHVAGIYAINTIAVAPETQVAPVERRYLSREELARIHEDEAFLAPPMIAVSL